MTLSLQNHSESREGFVTRPQMTKFAYIVYSAVTVALLMVSADLVAAPRRGPGAGTAGTMLPAMASPMGPSVDTGMDTGMHPAAAPSTHPNGDRPSPDEVLQPEEHIYRPVQLEVRKIVWFEPGQRGLIEAHPLVMGLAAMALATVTLLFFFLHGIKRPKDGDI